MLDEQDLTRVVAAFRNELEARRSVSESTHKKHHEFIELRMDEMRIQRERREKIKAQVGGWAVIALVSGFVAAVWEWFKRHVAN